MSPRLTALLLAVCACSAAGRPKLQLPADSQYCEMAATVLSAVVKSHGEQPFGLEAGCVKARATAAGKVFVDARFNDGKDRELVPQRSCVRGDYVIRFDFQNFERAPAPEVVLLIVYEVTAQGREFYAQMEEADWPRKKPGVVALSQCRSARGVLTRSPAGWTALVTPPARDPDGL